MAARYGQTKPMSRIVFEKYDTNGNNLISESEFKNMCYDLGYCLSDDEVAVAFAMLDTDHSGSIGYDEFQSFWTTDERFDKLRLTDAQLQKVHALAEYFRYFDTDRSGSIDATEFRALFENLVQSGFQLSDVESTLARLNPEGDGEIKLNNFMSYMLEIGSLQL
eukprot:GILK01004384.1.p1 GENE.GILK01004384.1~~GILK01004384.1.p1  ORF type:complete len:180 (+),score=19.12 GILK01004384.1:49-540(+)